VTTVAYMDDDEPVFCMTCHHTTRIQCPHVPHRGDPGAFPNHRSAPGGQRIPAGMREYRTSWAAPAAPARQAPLSDLELRRIRLRELTLDVLRR
jgi:hypothetical protein